MGFDLKINTCGACAGNPALMGIGGTVVNKSNNEILYSFSLAPGTGTSNEAQYLALTEALQWVTKSAIKPESIATYSDSHLLICQCLSNDSLEDERLINLCKTVHVLIKTLCCKIDFIWTTQEKNSLAQALALKAAGMPCSLIKEDKVLKWEEDLQYVHSEAEESKLPDINSHTRYQINLLNNCHEINTSCLVSLLTYGMDKYSRAKISDLLDFIEIRYGTYTKDYLIEVLADSDSYYCKNVLRWVARGLKPTLAFVKARIDTEIKENA